MIDVRKRRLELGLTQVEVAREVGVSVFTLRSWEQRVCNPLPENERKLHRVLQLD